MPITKSAMVYRSTDGIVRIDPSEVTTVGLHVSTGAGASQLREPSHLALGVAVIEALADGGKVMPHPAQDEWSGRQRQWLRAMGAPSYRRFMRDNVGVSVSRQSDRLMIESMYRRGAQGGYVASGDAVSLPADAAPASIGAAVDSALAAAK